MMQEKDTNSENTSSVLATTKSNNVESNIEMIKVHTPNFFERHFLHVLILFGLGFLIFTYVFSIHFKPIYIVGTSMQPTINSSVTSETDHKHCDLVYYQKHGSYNIGNIVLVDSAPYLYEHNQSDPIIKRIIAKANQTITFNLTKTGRQVINTQQIIVYTYSYTLLLDGEPLTESYIKDEISYLQFRTDLSNNYNWYGDYKFIIEIYNTIKENSTEEFGEGEFSYSYTLKDNEYFVCGDNRNNSTDSRYFGAVNAEDIMGSVSIHVPYGQNLFVTFWKAIWKKQ